MGAAAANTGVFLYALQLGIIKQQLMRLYVLTAVLAALCVTVPWITQRLIVPTGLCEVQVWLWLAWGTSLGWIARMSLMKSALGAPPPTTALLAVSATAACAAFQLPLTLGATPALGALFWATAGTFATERTALVAWEAREASRTGATWTLATDAVQ